MPKNTKKIVAVAMSGGVDSSVAAAMMVDKGYEVIGLTMQLYDSGRITSVGSKTCCAGQDIYDAKRVSDKLGIRHYTLDYEKNFLDNVIQDFADSYAKGVTPIPCIRCNQKMKFKDLLDTSLEPMRPDTPLSVLTRSFAAYNLVALPVVDETGSLVGAVTFDDLVDHMLPQGWRELPDGWGHDDPVMHRD